MNRQLENSKARALASEDWTSYLRSSMRFLSPGLSGGGNKWVLSVVCLGLALMYPETLCSFPSDVRSSQSALSVEAYDFVEVTLNVAGPDAKNPFIDASVEGQFGRVGESARLSVDGFCDSQDGSVYRIRFMPTSPGDYVYSATYRQGSYTKSLSGTFKAVKGNRKGVVRVDSQYPWHFIWSGTGEHYFWNATTAYWLMGWQDEKVITAAIDRLHRLKVNRVRVLVAGRSDHNWSEPVNSGADWTYCLNPWPAQRPNDVSNPGFDYTRFNLPYWQKYERMLAYARQRDMLFSVVFDIGDSPVHPADGSEDELRYFRYTVARLSAFSNLTWDLGNGSDWYRKWPSWANQMGTQIKKWDPYKHLDSVHTEDVQNQPRSSEWFDMTLVQWWTRPLHNWMLAQRREQIRLGRIIPQVNEEYGYEDHYPTWSPNYPDGQSADANRRAAWEIYMAGCYQTTGETAKRGTGAWPDTGGGWVNGRGDDSMVMLNGYAHIVDFFTSFEWWKTDPHDELAKMATHVPGVPGDSVVPSGAYCLAEMGKIYAVYLPFRGTITLNLGPGSYQASWFNPRNGKWIPISNAEGPQWTSPPTPDGGDWALLLRAM
ncbi:MAG TPA: DUF4038 domain-containing protein [Terriglobia bacterium]|nr:DUF4038 domain-containing protein [Terriglobia bacterium]